MVASSERKDVYDFDDLDDTERFIREVIKPNYEEAGGSFKFRVLAVGMPILTGLHRLMEHRTIEIIPINHIQKPLKKGELVLEWNGAEDCSWCLL